MNENNLNSKLTRIDTAISEMRNRLKLEENASIEDVAEKTNLETLSNIFVQPNTPSTLDGIWIKTDKKYPYNNIILDKDVIIPYKWQPKYFSTPIKKTFSSSAKGNVAIRTGSNIVVKNDFAYFYTDGGLCKYDLKTNNNTAVHMEYNSNYSKTKAVTSDLNSFIYYLNGSGSSPTLYSCSLTTGYVSSRGRLSTSYGISELSYSTYDDCVYAKDSYNILIYKTDGTYVKGFDNWKMPCGSNHQKILPLGNKVLIISSGSQSFLIDIDNEYTITQTPEAVKKVKASANASIVDMGDHFYIFEGLDSVIKYDKETFEAEDVTALFADPEMSPIYAMFCYKEDFYAFTGSKDSEIYLRKMETKGTEYDTNAVILSQAPISKTEYQTALWTYPFIQGKLKQSFYDVFYYSQTDGFIKGFPTYYGDGTKWIKFKN